MGALLLTLILQSPTDAQLPRQVQLAMKRLEAEPGDPAASTVVGLYLLEVGNGSPLEALSKSQDPTLKKAAEEELSAEKDGGAPYWSAAGEAWLTAFKKLKKSYLSERAVLCFSKAWAKSDGPEREFLRSRLLTISSPPNDYAKPTKGAQGSARGWWGFDQEYGSFIDSRFVRSGRSSLKLLPTKGGGGNPDGWSSGECLNVQLGSSKSLTASAWVFCHGTDTDGMFDLYFRDSAGKRLTTSSTGVPGDSPFWRRVEIKAEAPAGATCFSVRVNLKISKGAGWVDDVVVSDGSKILFTSGFEP